MEQCPRAEPGLDGAPSQFHGDSSMGPSIHRGRMNMKNARYARNSKERLARGAGSILGGNLGSLTFYVCLSYKMKLVPQTFVLRTYILHRRGAVVIGAHRAGVKERASSAWQYISHAYAHLLRCKCYVTEARSTHLPSAIVTF